MNYLAHAHLAYLSDTSITGNLLGDFVKGDVNKLPYDAEIRNGVRLHRAIDTFTDKHPITRKYKQDLGELRRYGGIIIDVFYDHLLAQQFEELTKSKPMALSDFSQMVYQQLSNRPSDVPERFHRVCNGMAAMDWFSGYQHIDNIERALNGISSRLSKPVELANSLEWFEQNQQPLRQEFRYFYNQLIDYVRKNV